MNPDLMFGQTATSSPEYRAKFPLGTVPAIDDGQVCLSESAAILAYLSDKHGWKDLYPTELDVRARVNEYLHWHHNGTRTIAKAYFAPRVRADQSAAAPDAQAEAEAAAQRALSLIEGKFLLKSGFVAGTSSATVADLLCYSEVPNDCELPSTTEP